MEPKTALIVAGASAVSADDLYEIEAVDDKVSLHIDEPMNLVDEPAELEDHRTARQLRQRHKTVNRKKKDVPAMTPPTTDTSRKAVERGMSVSMLTKLIHCDPDNGILTWRERAHNVHPSWSAGRLKAWNSRYAGTPALSSVCKVNGYKTGYVMGRAFRSHRVVWAMTYGRWPENHIDHVNGDKTDNRIENLRDITNEENTRNARYVRSGRSIVPGVQWVPRLNKWQARIGGMILAATLASIRA